MCLNPYFSENDIVNYVLQEQFSLSLDERIPEWREWCEALVRAARGKGEKRKWTVILIPEGKRHGTV